MLNEINKTQTITLTIHIHIDTRTTDFDKMKIEEYTEKKKPLNIR